MADNRIHSNLPLQGNITTPFHTTRRQVLAGLAAIIAAQKAPAILRKDMIAARQIFLGRGAGGGWVNPYVTDGLVAMWDGQWNAGGGVHDANATTWIDVVNGYEATPANSYYSWGTNCVITDADTPNRFDTTVIGGATVVTIEACAIINKGHVYANNGIMGNFSGYLESPNPNSLGGIVIGAASATATRCVWYAASPYSFRNAYVFPKGTMSVKWESGSSASFWMNGEMEDSVSSSTLIENTEPFTLCGYHAPIMKNLNEIASGAFHCFRIYSRALTAAEIAANYAVDRARFNLP